MTCIYHKHRDQTDKIDLVDRLTTGTMHANIQASNERFNLLFVGIPKHSTKKKSQFVFKKSWLCQGLISNAKFSIISLITMYYNLNLFDELHQIQENPTNHKVEILPPVNSYGISFTCYEDTLALIEKEDYQELVKIWMSYMKEQMKKKYFIPACLICSPSPTKTSDKASKHQDKTFEELWDVLDDDNKSIFKIYKNLTHYDIWKRRSDKDKQSFQAEMFEKFPVLRFTIHNHITYESDTRFQSAIRKFVTYERLRNSVISLEEELKSIDLKDMRNHFDKLIT